MFPGSGPIRAFHWCSLHIFIPKIHTPCIFPCADTNLCMKKVKVFVWHYLLSCMRIFVSVCILDDKHHSRWQGQNPVILSRKKQIFPSHSNLNYIYCRVLLLKQNSVLDKLKITVWGPAPWPSGFLDSLYCIFIFSFISFFLLIISFLLFFGEHYFAHSFLSSYLFSKFLLLLFSKVIKFPLNTVLPAFYKFL